MMTKVYLINDTSAHPNWGSQATTAALKELIKAADGELFASLPLKQLSKPNWESSSKRHNFSKFVQARAQGNKITKKLASVSLNRLIKRLPDVIPQNYSQFANYAHKVANAECLQEIAGNIQAADVILINGEGGIKDKNRESRAMLFLAYLAKKVYNKPVAFINHTADFCHPDLKEMAQNVYPILDDVVFRESYSAQKCSEFVQAAVAADVGFYFKPSPYNDWLKLAKRPDYFNNSTQYCNFDPSKPYICIGGSSAYSKKNYPDFRELCKLLKAEFGQLVLTTSARIDEEIFCPIAKELNLPLIPLMTPARQAVDILANAKAYIGGRWHGAIFAFSGGAVVIPLASENFKLEALMRQMNLDTAIFDAFNFDEKEIVKLTKDYLGQEQLRTDILKRANSLAKTVNRHVALVSGTHSNQVLGSKTAIISHDEESQDNALYN